MLNASVLTGLLLLDVLDLKQKHHLVPFRAAAAATDLRDIKFSFITHYYCSFRFLKK